MRDQDGIKRELTRRKMLRILFVLPVILFLYLPARAADTEPEGPSLATILQDGLPGIETNQFLRALQQCPGSSFRLTEGDKPSVQLSGTDIKITDMEKEDGSLPADPTP